MKKHVTLAVLAVMATGQLAAAAGAGGKEGSGKPRAVESREAGKSAERARETGAKADVNPGRAAKDGFAKTTLKADEKTDLMQGMAQRPEVKAAAEAALANLVQFPELSNATLVLLAKVSKEGLDLSPAAEGAAKIAGKGQNEYAFALLALETATAAASWTPQNRENLTFLMQKMADAVTSGKTVEEAVNEGLRELLNQKGTKIDLAKLKDLCKKQKA